MDAVPASKTIQISGITYHFVERLEHPLLVQLWINSRGLVSVLLRREEKQDGVRSFQTPRSLYDESILTIQVQEKYRDKRNKVLARLNLSLENLWIAQGHQARKHRILLDDPGKQIWLNLNAFVSQSDSIDVDQSLRLFESPSEQLEELVRSSSNSAVQRLRELRSILDRLGWAKHPVETVLKFGTTVNEMNVLSQAVLESVKVVYEQVGTRTPGHKEILGLSESMAKTVNYIQPVKDIAEMNELKKTLEMFPDLMQETAIFIETWLKQNVLGGTPSMPSGKDKIDNLTKRHGIFETEFERGLKIDKMLSLNTSQDWMELKDRLLEGMKVVDSRATECMPGTRAMILAEVDTKVDDREGPNTIWIRGAPGSGKSSISLSAKSFLQRQRRLVTYFRFDRNEAAATTPATLWRRVAYDLARRLPSLRTQLLQRLREDTVNLDSSMDVFTLLVEEPLSKAKDIIDRPLAIVIDALDECGGLAGHLSPDRQMLLQALRRWTRLPKHFKLLVTSRDEGDISRVLPSISISIDIPSGDSLTRNPKAEASIHAANDIRMYLRGRFQRLGERLPSLPRDWPGTVVIDEMVDRAAGVFMWATAAANFIDGRGINPQDRLKRIMGHSPESRGMQPLYSLYIAILETAFGEIADDDDLDVEALQSVLATMVLARRPLHDIEYIRVLSSKSVMEAMIDSVRDGLRSVLAPGTNLRFTHKSFDDFLLSKECPARYRIRVEESHYVLTNFCLSTMTEGLHFNMCNLETSCLRNADVADMETKVTNAIPSLLSYSCCFVADHLSLTLFDEYLMDQVKEMVMHKLLYWFEAMSLLKEMNRVSPSLLQVLKWSHLSPDDEFRDFLHDAHRFIGAFSHPIALSAPHIYISALPFAPKYSSVAQYYLSQFPRVLSLSSGKPNNWPPSIFTSEYHEGAASSVTFSPDEKHFASGSEDKSVCVYDSETGRLTSGPFQGDRGVYCVFFDPDGRHIWASYSVGSVICWDIETGDRHLVFDTREYEAYCRFNGQKVISAGETKIALWSAETGDREIYREHPYSMQRAAISPDGECIAFPEKNDGTVKIWRLVHGSEIQEPPNLQPQFKHMEGVSALSFSVDGNFVVSGSDAGTILIWDARTGDTIGHPLTTEGRVHAVVYSPKNQLLISSGKSGTMMVWNALTHEAVLGPLEGHTSWIREIALSRDGRRALTASNDWTVRMWDLGVRGTIASAIGDHQYPVLRVTFSPCEKKLASLDERTIHIWDSNAATGPLLLIKVSNQRGLPFSPDGSRIVAYSHKDGTITGWNAGTGKLCFHLDLTDGQERCAAIDHATFRSTDQRLITCFSNGSVRIWRLENNTLTEDAPIPSPPPVDPSCPVTIAALSSDGLIAVVHDNSRSPHCYLWSTTTHQPLPLTFADGEHITGDVSAAYSPSGQFFVSTEMYRRPGVSASEVALGVWNTRTGELVSRSSMFDAFMNFPSTLAFSPDDRHIAVIFDSPGSRGFWILDAHTGNLTGPWSGHNDRVLALAFSPDGKKLLSGSIDRQIRVWNADELFGDSQVSFGFLGMGSRMEDGWVKDANENLLFWVPKDHRAKLVWPQSVLVGESGTMTELDFSRFTYGETWAKCFSGEI